MNPCFNLWTQDWITVERENGTLDDLSLEQTFLDAPHLLSLHDPSPLVVVGIQRLLTAILQDIIAPQRRADLNALWQAGHFPEDEIRAFGERYAHRFDLFSETAPFLQSADLSREPQKGDPLKTITYLMPQIPAGGEVTHYRHGVASDNVFCPICAARGLLVQPAFASSGGAGIKPSINGVPPIYVLPGGATLFERLAATLLLPKYQPDAASLEEDAVWWRHSPIIEYKGIVQDVGYLHSLTFPARRIRLHPQRMRAPCSRCGGTKGDWRVTTMVYQMGESRPNDAPPWFDPFAAYRVREDNPPVPLRPVEGKALWREYAGLFLPMTKEEGQKEHTLPPSALYQRGTLAFDNIGLNYTRFPVHCVGLRTDMKAKIFEWVEAGFDVPTTLLNDPVGGDTVRQAVDFATGCARILAATFRTAFSREGAEHHKDVKDRMLDAYWAALAAPFRAFILGVADAETRDAAYTTWVNTAVAQGKHIFREYADAIGDSAIALRHRVEGIHNCNRSLNARRKKELGEEKGDS
ncbi:MAG TPA: type I-E CRISPR-associated protein Cse1/CasA [Anaerolineae bacterium]|nr:type I-E CRISPR-associated protein Cse1/CasA [Anaerolineae bacterium]